MKVTNLAFHGFSSDAAKKSCTINNILLRLIYGVERDIEIVTSTPKSERKMEISLTKHFHMSVDHDSGYMSNHQESNSDSSLENGNETLPNPTSSKPIYLSEDALLEKPEVNVKIKNIDTRKRDEWKTIPFIMDFDRNDESRFISTSPDTVLSTSVVSQRTSYSGFDESDSDTSIEISCSKPIIIENVDDYIQKNDISCDIDNSLNTSECSNLITQSDTQNSFSFAHYTDQFEGNENCLALNNITNTTTMKNCEKKKRLTLIFSKSNKENMYSVKRKYQSISPEKNTMEKSDLDNSYTSEENNLEQISQEDGRDNSCVTNYEEISESINLNYGQKETSRDNLGEIETNITINCENTESPKKELILKKELDLEEIVLQQENVKYHQVLMPEDKLICDIQNEKECPAKSIQQDISVSATPKKKFENPVDPNISPDLFDNDEITQEVEKECQPLNRIAEERYIIKKDQRLLKRAQNSLKGVLPPRSMTVMHLSVDEMLNRLDTNKEYFWTNDKPSLEADKSNDNLNSSNESNAVGESKSLLVTGDKDCVDAVWPHILNKRYHGLHHNRSKISEELEELFTKYGQRYVGAETQSSCTIFEENPVSPSKRKQMKQRWAVKSPGRRLSHLAKRRITFSSANLQGGASSSILGSRARQILVDAKKLDLLNRRKSPRKSPKKSLRRTPRKTPSKSPRLKARTPSSSAKKKLAMRFRELTGEIEKTVPSTSSAKSMFSSKRALFQSPDRENKSCLFQPSTSGLSAFENELKKPSTKRALFLSPRKNSPLKNSALKRSPFKRLDLGVEKKRKRLDSDDAPPSKLARSVSVDNRPSESETSAKFSRTRSEMNISLNRSQAGPSGELSAVHKKKLQWAVYESLRSQNVTPTHPQFKIFASVLARVTRRLLPNLASGGPKECGTTETMLRIARRHVYAVIKGKSVDETINEYLRARARNVKPQGYVGPEDFGKDRRNSEASAKENISQARMRTQQSVDRKKLELLGKPKAGTESRIDRIRKVINFGDDNR